MTDFPTLLINTSIQCNPYPFIHLKTVKDTPFGREPPLIGRHRNYPPLARTTGFRKLITNYITAVTYFYHCLFI